MRVLFNFRMLLHRHMHNTHNLIVNRAKFAGAWTIGVICLSSAFAGLLVTHSISSSLLLVLAAGICIPVTRKRLMADSSISLSVTKTALLVIALVTISALISFDISSDGPAKRKTAETADQPSFPHDSGALAVPQARSTDVVSITGRVWSMKKEIPVFNGPSEDSGRMFYAPTAKPAMTLDEYEPYELLAVSGDWSQVKILSQSGWVRSSSISRFLPYSVTVERQQDRMDVFNSTMTDNKWRGMYAGARYNNSVLVVLVNDTWHLASEDAQQGWTMNVVRLWVSLGAVRYLDESLNNLDVEIRHVDSNRVLAKWNSIRGFRVES
jgi:hypothetical protein